MSHDTIGQYIDSAIAAARRLALLPVIAVDSDASARVAGTIEDLEGLRRGVDAVPAGSPAVTVMTVQRVDDTLAELQSVLAGRGGAVSS